MSQHKFVSCIVILLCAVSLNSMATKPIRGATKFQAADVCGVLNNAKMYLNKEISLRGKVFTGMDGANIRDVKCPDKGIALSVEEDRYKQADILLFFQRIRSFGNHGYATIVGRFVATGSQSKPYSLSIQKVSDVTRTVN